MNAVQINKIYQHEEKINKIYMQKNLRQAIYNILYAIRFQDTLLY